MNLQCLLGQQKVIVWSSGSEHRGNHGVITLIDQLSKISPPLPFCRSYFCSQIIEGEIILQTVKQSIKRIIKRIFHKHCRDFSNDDRLEEILVELEIVDVTSRWDAVMLHETWRLPEKIFY